jgi:hypothetical protein
MMFDFENWPSTKEFKEMGHPDVKEFAKSMVLSEGKLPLHV